MQPSSKPIKISKQSDDFSPEAMPLVLFNPQKNKFEINEDTRDFLRKLDAPIGVISVAGMYRTGKSYLLNRMLLNQSRGFDVGPTINACTKGVWIWGKPIDGTTPDGEPIKVLVLDTEGLGALDEDSNHDVRIFSLAILLASFFIYNSVGSIDENALQQLSLVINLTKHIQIKAGGVKEETDPEEYAQYFPSFMWVVRDFTLKLEDPDGETITSKEYLEKALGNQKGFSESVEQKNRIRRLLKSFFKERDCCTMIRPLTNEDQLQNLADMDLSKLRPEFVDQIGQLRRKVINRIKPKSINGRKLNGEMLFNLAESYVDAINKGAVPSIESSWSYICKNECLRASQDAYEIFLKELDTNFQESAPMPEDELKSIYKSAKKNTLDKFNKVAVGDVREEYLRQLKEKMSDKLDWYKNENINQTEQQCYMFLNANYESIEHKLRNQEYKCLDDLSHEIKDFEQFYLDQGPKGPCYREIGLEFCYKSLAEGSDYFNKTVQNELYLQTQLAEQTQKKLRSELVELKQIHQSDHQNLEQKLRQGDIERAELGAKEQSVREQLQLLQKEKERLESESEIKLIAQRKESLREMEQLNEKKSQQESILKETSRRQMQSDSEHDKQKALYEQQIEFITERNKALEEKERELSLELKQQKLETSSWKADQKTKFEQQIQDLQKKVEELTDANFDMETRVSNADQIVTESQQKLQEQENTIRKELQKAKEIQMTVQKQNEELKLKCDTEITQVLKQKEQDCLSQAQQIEELELDVKELLEENEALKSKFEKDQAINNQKLEFLSVQLEQERNQRQEEKRNHDRMLKSIQSSQRESVIGKEEATKQLDDLKDQFQLECQNMQTSFDSQIAQKEKEIRQLSENCQKFELEIQLRDADFRKEIEILRENLGQAEQERDKLRQTCKGLEAQRSRQMDDVNSRYHGKITELEQELEEKERLHESQIQEINSQFEEQIQQLKAFYEQEKQRLEQRFNDEKERNSRRMNELIREHEQKLREESNSHEDEMEMLQSDLNHQIEENKQVIAHFESEISLREQRVDALEKYLSDTKEALDKQQMIHASQIEALQAKINSERRELTDKVDALTQEITRKERTCTTLENQKEALTGQIAQRDKQLLGMKDEAAKERSDLAQRYQDLKSKIDEKEDELTQRKIDFERERALNQQQIQFTEQKASDLNIQLERTVQRYEDRIKMDREELQREIKEKSQRLQAEKENADAKFDAKRKQCKELEAKLQKEIATAEREKAVLILKQQNLENQQENLQRNLEAQIVRLREQNQQLSDALASDQQAISQELDRARKECAEMERQLQDAVNNYDKDKALWEGKFAFLEQQRDQSKRDLDEASQKFQSTVEQLQKVQSDSKSKNDMSHSQVMTQMQTQLNQRLKEAQEAHQNANYELNQKVRQLEREKAQIAEKLELVSRDQMSESGNLIKKLDKLQDQTERLSEELDTVKRERDQKITEYQQKLEKEREVFNQKKRELDQKSSKTESKQTELLLNHERERAKWDQQLTDIMHQREDFKAENDRLKMKVDSYFKEIEKLKLDIKNQRKTYFNAQQQQQTAQGAYSANLGANLLTKLNLPRQSSGYQPGMYASTRIGAAPEDTGAATAGGGTDRSFNGRYGQYPTGVKEVNSSMELSKMGSGFLSQSLAGSFQPKGKTNLGFDSRLGGLGSNGDNNKNLGGSAMNIGDMLDTSAHQNNLLSTPSSKNDDNELLQGSDQEE